MRDTAAEDDDELALREELRRLRKVREYTMRQVAAAMDWPQSKVSRIEKGTVRISTNDLKALLLFYQLDTQRANELLEANRRHAEYTDKRTSITIAPPPRDR